jgi:hypothetical protein
MMEWRDINACPDHTKGVFGYWTQFDKWYFTTFESKDEPVRLGYTHWLDMKEPDDAPLR